MRYAGLTLSVGWIAWIAVALSLGGCVVYVPVPGPPAAAPLANPCAAIDCNRPDTRRIA